MDSVQDNAQVAPPSNVVELCRETFIKTAEYLRGELDGELGFMKQ